MEESAELAAATFPIRLFRHPFLFQDGILESVFIDRIPFGVTDERDELPELRLAAQADFSQRCWLRAL